MSTSRCRKTIGSAAPRRATRRTGVSSIADGRRRTHRPGRVRVSGRSGCPGTLTSYDGRPPAASSAASTSAFCVGLLRAPPQHLALVAQHERDLVDGRDLDVVDAGRRGRRAAPTTTAAASCERVGAGRSAGPDAGHALRCATRSRGTPRRRRRARAADPPARPRRPRCAPRPRSARVGPVPGHLDGPDLGERAPTRARRGRSTRRERLAERHVGPLADPASLSARAPRPRPLHLRASRRRRPARSRRRRSATTSTREHVAPGQPAARPLPARERGAGVRRVAASVRAAPAQARAPEQGEHLRARRCVTSPAPRVSTRSPGRGPGGEQLAATSAQRRRRGDLLGRERDGVGDEARR